MMRIAVLGDICPSSGYAVQFDTLKTERIFGKVISILEKCDFSVCNLEEPLSYKGKPIKKSGGNLHGKPEWFQHFENAGIKICSMANNHVCDFGEEALHDTLCNASKWGIKAFGAGINEAEASKPIFIEKDNFKVGFLSFAEEEFNCAYGNKGGANRFDPYYSFDKINETKKKCDYLIILYHGGIEHYKMPSPLLQKKCRKMVDCGADIILCQHSHCIGTLEKYKEKTILYGQGNTLFSYMPGKDQWNTGLIVTIDFSSNNLPDVNFHLIKANTQGIDLAEEKESEARVLEIYEESKLLNDAKYISSEWEKFCSQNSKSYLPMLFGWNRIANKINQILNGKLIYILTMKKNRRTVMNLIRCESHKEVCQTILEREMKNE